MAAPLVFLGAIALAFVALVVFVRSGGVADGERVKADLITTCAAQSIPILKARANAVGLGAPELTESANGVTMHLTLPEDEPDARTIPQMLARQGVLTMTSQSGVKVASNTQITGSGVEIDTSGMPTTLVQLDSEAKSALTESLKEDAPITVHIDGQIVAEYNLLPDLDDGYLELPSGEGVTAKRMRVAADRAILLSSGPLPCAATLQGVVPAAAP